AGRWTLVRRHHKLVRVRGRAHFKTVRVIRCHAHTARIKVQVWVTVVEHGKRVRVRRTRVVRVVLPPHLVTASRKRVRFGHRTTVSGWLGTTRFKALAGQTVEVLTAPDNGQGAFTPAAVVSTNVDGFWNAHLPPGPSRLVEAIYAGGADTEPSTSSQAHLVVPASVRLHVRPTATRWGRTIYISGSLQGGYLPPAGELVVLWIGWRGGSAEIGHLYTGPDGRFQAPYTFLRGNGTQHYQLWSATARESDYPFSAARSRRISVTVGPG
ncbi:MAG: hypothetical protein M3018_02995, partial [Actinomycetota bacterium]|nr:hypothetical protein [Actinomycetota bacterium]